MGKALKLHPAQDRIISTLRRFIVALSGIQGGKTTVGGVWICQKLQKDREAELVGDYLICAPTVKILQQSTIPKFKEIFPPDWGEWKEQRQCFDLAWGGKIFVRSTEDPDHLEGMTLLAAWMDEAGQMKEQAWINIQGRLSIHEGPCLLTTTPYMDGWFWELVRSIRDDQDPDYEFVTWKSVDNPGFPKAEYERAKRRLSKAVFERRYEGKLARMEGLIYADVDDNNYSAQMVIPGAWKRFAGIDFGRAMTAIVFVAEEPEEWKTDPKTNEKKLVKPSVYYVYREFYKSQVLLREISAHLQREEIAYILGDPRSAQEIAELQKVYGIKHIQKADNKVDIGIERIATLIKENRLKFIKKRVPNTVEELELYHFAPGQEVPVKAKDHAMDALKYAFSRQIKTLYQHRVKRQTRRFSSRLARVQPDPFTGYY